MKTPAFTPEKAKEIGNRVNVNWKHTDLEQFRAGLETEMEHGKKNPETNITDDDELLTAKIALAHLAEIPDYYTRLQKMEHKAGREWERRRKIQLVKNIRGMNNITVPEDLKNRKIKLEECQLKIPSLIEQLAMLQHGAMKKNLLKKAEKYQSKLDEANKNLAALKNKIVILEMKAEKTMQTEKTMLKRSLLHEKQKVEKMVAAYLKYFDQLLADLKSFLHVSGLYKAEHATF